MDNRLYFLLSQVQQRVYREVDAIALEQLGVTAVQTSALMYLQKQNGCLQAELGAALGLGKAGISGLVSRLVRAGYVKRSPSPVDGRGQRVLLTTDGLQVLLKARPLMEQVNNSLEQGFSAKEIAVVKRYLQTLKERLD